MDDRLERKIKEIPPEGWFYKSGYERFIQLALALETYNIPEEEIILCLKSAYLAVANEYGE